MEWMYGMNLSVVAWNNVKPTMNSVYKMILAATREVIVSSLAMFDLMC